ncbi:chromosome segregation protein SMC [Alkalicoccus urumqiensis]|uniref:Chromosome partition protein Smc n=1 Tax=Alkalicoccus urumqiensis TaxID=1548213 RepID=A0A2P6MG64_ALKUR|nr:chromosome segregation protein SMC [Alkalicoccus urumqiensis]PRO65257.1 chromosome segregation protein SMC [Alkalicoccus urumqiensis]
MFLKRLELSGFKSFADRVQVEFESGVTAVVGPNGSGKSNISDAVKWVLGEKSAKSLRGTKMEDVIFAGSEDRRPVQMAEITLVLNNEEKKLPIDYTEVAVTRRVFRSGESDYLINNHPCRLKDIIELFMDSGIGRESFSIIGQGRVEEILSTRAEERRAVIEEAAGVRKYQQRKLQSEKKLTDTEENLSRVKDILHELSQQVEPLKEQASAAEEFLAQKAELKDIETAVLAADIEELHKNWTRCSEKLEELSAEETALKRHIKELEGAQASLRSQLEEKETEHENVQEELITANREVEQQESRMKLHDERRRHYAENRTQYRRELEQLHLKKKELDEEVEEQQKKHERLQADLREAEEAFQATSAQLKAVSASGTEDLESLKSQYFDKRNERAAAGNELRYEEERLDRENKRRERWEAQNGDLIEEIQEQKDIEAELSELRSRREKETASLVTTWQNTRKSLEKLESARSEKEQMYYEGLRRLSQKKADKEALEQLQQDYAGYFQGVKSVLKERGSFAGIHGAAAELFTVPKAYRLAVETALGAAQQHIIADTEKTAQQAITLLRQRRLGRATFLPLDTIRSREISSNTAAQAEQVDGYCGTGSQLVHAEDMYITVKNHLLGNVLITKDLDAARAVSKATGRKFRVVTLEGDVMNPGGAMTGGSVQKKQSAILGRGEDIEKAAEECSRLEAELDKLQQKMKLEQQQTETAQRELKELEMQGEEARQQEIEARHLEEQARMKRRTLQEKLDEAELELTGPYREEGKDRVEALKETCSGLDKELEELDRKMKDAAVDKEKSTETIQRLQQETTDLQVALASKKEQTVHAEETLRKMKEEAASLGRTIIEKDEANSLLEAELSDQTAGAGRLDEDLEKKKKKREELERSLKEIRGIRADLRSGLENGRVKLETCYGRSTWLQEQRHTQELEMSRLDGEMEQRLTKLREEYELSYEAARAAAPLTMELSEAREQVKLLRMSMDELGPVNLGAIEEYARVKERFDFLSSQKQDLDEARETLLNVISEMDDEMTTRFKTTFEDIKREFSEVFKELFGGGKASLELTEPDSLLTSGVEIQAQPPGKKLQHLNLLSGGERSLTAIALLFAILRVKPVPFCVLDEVEAALDEANVTRFASYVKEFSRDTQFIVVTHRKGTMEQADALYGVTMQDSGVSSLVSVRLEETDELVEAGAERGSM